jgi:hypothetical protein
MDEDVHIRIPSVSVEFVGVGNVLDLVLVHDGPEDILGRRRTPFENCEAVIGTVVKGLQDNNLEQKPTPFRITIK